MQATKNNTKEETIRKFKQLLKHKEEMLERAKQYDGIDIYAEICKRMKAMRFARKSESFLQIPKIFIILK